jgi:hypothetical protein
MAAPRSTSSAVTPKDIWDGLKKIGASAVSAAGIMGNMINESSLNVETGLGGTVIDSNGYPVYGLVSWNAADYPTASQLVTGNPAADLRAQLDFLAQTGGLQAASGTTVAETASNFAANYERCQGCAAGGSQNASRVAQAQTVAGWAAAGNWPSSAGSASDTATLTAADSAAATAQQKQCLWSISNAGVDPSIFGWHPVGSVGAFYWCLFDRAQARAWIGAGLLVGGILITAAGLAMMLKAAAVTQLAGVASVASKVAGPVAAVAGPEAGVAAAATSAARPRQGTRADSTGTSPEFRSAFL